MVPADFAAPAIRNPLGRPPVSPSTNRPVNFPGTHLLEVLVHAGVKIAQMLQRYRQSRKDFLDLLLGEAGGLLVLVGNRIKSLSLLAANRPWLRCRRRQVRSRCHLAVLLQVFDYGFAFGVPSRQRFLRPLSLPPAIASFSASLPLPLEPSAIPSGRRETRTRPSCLLGCQLVAHSQATELDEVTGYHVNVDVLLVYGNR